MCVAVTLAASPSQASYARIASMQAPPTPAATPATAPALVEHPTVKQAAKCKKLDYRVAVQVDAAPHIIGRLRRKAEKEILRFDVLLGEDAAKLPVIVIKVVAITGDDEGFAFTIDINHEAQKPIKDGSSVGECKLCTESELLEKVAGMTQSMMPKLRAYITDFNNRPCDPPALDVPPPPECQQDADCDHDARLPLCHPVLKKCLPDLKLTPTPATPAMPSAGKTDALKKTGLGLMVFGGVGVGVGVGLAVAPDTENRSTRLPGIAVLTVGAAVLATGVALYVVGRRRSRGLVTPIVSGGTYGFAWSGRF